MNSLDKSVPKGQIAITAVVPAYRRIRQALRTLSRLKECEPAPAAIVVHVDGNQTECASAIHGAHPDVHVILSEFNLGPGGGRNRLIAASPHAIVASFDDDSYPLDLDYFERLTKVFEDFPEASVVSARVYQPREQIEPDLRTAEWVADFNGGACAYRRDRFLETGGYVPIPVAYGLEEIDLALRLHASGRRILRTPWLRVYHDADLSRHADPGVTEASISNLALLAYLRYPAILWPVGVWQCLNRIRWLVTKGRLRGIETGLARIPSQLAKYEEHKNRVPAKAVCSYLALRKRTLPATWTTATNQRQLPRTLATPKPDEDIRCTEY